MQILGISAFYHDSAAALVRDGRIVAAAQEERFSRRRHDPSFPRHAIEYCLSEAGTSLPDLDFVAFYDKPFLKFERLLETYLAFAPRGFRSFAQAVPLWSARKVVPAAKHQPPTPRPHLREDAVHRASSQSRRQRLFPLAIRGSRRSNYGRRGRMGHHFGSLRPR